MNRKQWTYSEYVTYILLTLVFLSSWTDINGVFTELPQIILTQPEHWRLGAHLTFFTNLGNIAPALLVLIKLLNKKRSLNPVPINYVIIPVGMISCCLLVFFWQHTTIIWHQERSTALLTLAFFLALLDCTSSVSFSDYIQQFRHEFTGALFLGESLTSIIPSLLAIVQGNGDLDCIPSTIGSNATQPVYRTARFSVSLYFFCLFLILTISLIAFLLLQWTSIPHSSLQTESPIPLKSPEKDLETVKTFIQLQTVSYNALSLTKTSYRLLLLGCTYTSSILFGLLLSLSAYVLMPYGHQVFYLGTVISPWMFTIIWLLGLIKPLLPKRSMFLLILLGTLTFSFNLFVSLRSPCPPFVGTNIGPIVILITWLSTYILLGYPRLIIANYVRNYAADGMFWYGVNIQIGACIGSVVSYLTIETFSLLKERLPCDEIIC